MSDNFVEQFFKDPADIHRWLRKHNLTVDDYSILPVSKADKDLYHGSDYFVNVKKGVFLFHEDIPAFPVCFGVVEGNFIAQFCQLNTLKGTPLHVKGDFLVRENNLTSLDFGPLIINGDYICSNNRLTRLGGPDMRLRDLGGNMSAEQNPIMAIDDFPLAPKSLLKLDCVPEQSVDTMRKQEKERKKENIRVPGFEQYYNEYKTLSIKGETLRIIFEQRELERLVGLDNQANTRDNFTKKTTKI